MSGKVKQPQDRQPKKAVARVREEAQSSVVEGLLGKSLTVVGRVGSATVTVLEDPMEWDADVPEILDGWARAGGAITAEVLPLLTRIISLEDGEKLKEIRPNLGASTAIARWLFGEDEETGEPDLDATPPVESLGESRAS